MHLHSALCARALPAIRSSLKPYHNNLSYTNIGHIYTGVGGWHSKKHHTTMGHVPHSAVLTTPARRTRVPEPRALKPTPARSPPTVQVDVVVEIVAHPRRPRAPGRPVGQHARLAGFAHHGPTLERVRRHLLPGHLVELGAAKQNTDGTAPVRRCGAEGGPKTPKSRANGLTQ